MTDDVAKLLADDIKRIDAALVRLRARQIKLLVLVVAIAAANGLSFNKLLNLF